MLTPGDFATEKERLSLTNMELNAERLLEGLEKECAAKPILKDYVVFGPLQKEKDK
jgi:hypothetical protein